MIAISSVRIIGTAHTGQRGETLSFWARKLVCLAAECTADVKSARCKCLAAHMNTLSEAVNQVSSAVLTTY